MNSQNQIPGVGEAWKHIRAFSHPLIRGRACHIVAISTRDQKRILVYYRYPEASPVSIHYMELGEFLKSFRRVES